MIDTDAPASLDGATPPAIIDLSDVLAQDAPVIRLPVYLLTPRSLGWGELIRVSELTGFDTNELEKMLAAGGTETLRAGEAFAYVLALRLDPGFTWEDMHRHRVEVVGPPAANPPEGATNGARSRSRSRPDGPRP